MPDQRLQWVDPSNGLADRIDVLYTDTPAGQPSTVLASVGMGVEEHVVAEADAPEGRRFGVRGVNEATTPETPGPLSNVVEVVAAPEPAAIAITTPVSPLEVGQTRQLAWDESGTEPIEVAWASSDEAVATVSAGGLVTAIAEGAATITGTPSNAAGGGTPDSYALTVEAAADPGGPGEALVWGMTDEAAATAGGTIIWNRVQGGLPPVGGGKLRSLRVYCRAQSEGALGVGARAAVYQGGTLDNPIGATLIADLGPFNSDSTEPGWVEIPANGEVFDGTAPLWLGLKGNAGGEGTVYLYWATTGASAGDLQTERGRADISAAMSGNRGVMSAWPETLNGEASFGNFWYPMYITYTPL